MAVNDPNRYGPFVTERCGDPPPSELLRGVEQFNRGEFFEQHETLEALWRAERDPVRFLYQGILLVGVGMLHLRRGNYPGAVIKLETAVRFLRWFQPTCQGVDVAGLIAEANQAREHLVALGPERLSEFPLALTPVVRLKLP